MRRFFGFLCLLVMLAPITALAQNNRELNEQLASKCFQDKEYEKAKELYQQLYKQKSQTSHFNQYVECLLRLGDYDTAEHELKKFIRSNPNYWKSKIDLVYVYANNGKNEQANNLLKEILKGVPNNKNSISNISNMFRSRLLYDAALAVLEKGAENNTEGYPFYAERASLYHSMNNYQQAFEYYFLELEAQPSQYNTVKNRFQTLLLYDVNKSIADEMRIALLKKTQEHPDNVEFAQLLIWFSLQEEDYDIALTQCKSIDRRLNDQDGQIINVANICLNNHQYEVAKDAFNYIIAKGKTNPYYGQALIGSIQTENQLFKDQHVTDRKNYERLSKKIGNAYSDVGSKEYPYLVEIQADIMAFQLDQFTEAIDLLLQTIEQTNNKPQQCRLKLKLADIYLYQDEVWEATLLYSQVDKSMKEEPLGHEARYRNAQLRYFIGEFAWAETQLNVLKAATSKLIANDAMTLSLIISDNLEYDTTGMELSRLARADFKIYQHKDDEALIILDSITNDNAQHEYYLPDALGLMNAKGLNTGAFALPEEEMQGVNTQAELAHVSNVMRREILAGWLSEGVRILDPETVYIGADVVLMPDVTIMPNVQIWGRSIIGEGSYIGSGSIITRSIVGRNVVVTAYAVIENSILRDSSKAGPFCYIRDNTVLEEGAFAGKFVELKNSHIGEGSKVPHLSYMGDATLGHDVNIGAGSITCNYDGEKKHKTVIGNNCFIGSNTMFVAPAEVEDGAATAAGSVITQKVPENSLGVGRARQKNIADWSLRNHHHQTTTEGEK